MRTALPAHIPPAITVKPRCAARQPSVVPRSSPPGNKIIDVTDPFQSIHSGQHINMGHVYNQRTPVGPPAPLCAVDPGEGQQEPSIDRTEQKSAVMPN